MKPPLAVTLYQSRRGGISLAGTPVWREGLRSESNDSEAMNQGSNLLTKKKIAESNSSFSEVISSVLPVRARWSTFAYACPPFVGLTGISQLALNRIKLAVIVIPFQLHPFGGESFSGFFHSRRIEQRPLTRLEHPPRGRFASGSLSGAPTGRIRKEKPNGCAFGYLPDFGLAFISTLAGFVSVKIFLARNCDLSATYPDWRGARKRNLYTYPRRGHLILRHARRLKAETRPKSHLVTI